MGENMSKETITETILQEVIFELYDIANGETKGSALIRALCREFAQRLETVENRLKCHNLGEIK